MKLATHKKSGKKFAIKLVDKADMEPKELIQMRKETEVLKMCQHRGIIRLVDVFEKHNFLYLVLDYLPGKDLFEYMQNRNFNLPEERAKQLLFQLVEAVKYLNSFGIMHRDLKLENIMMTDTSDTASPVIVDFGLAKIMGPQQQTTESFGSVGYAAPEVLQRSPYSFSCDVWSLGCIAHVLVSGTLPFDHELERETIRKTLKEPLSFKSKFWNKISGECKDLLAKMLVKEPEGRLDIFEVAAHSWFDSVRPQFETCSPEKRKELP